MTVLDLVNYCATHNIPLDKPIALSLDCANNAYDFSYEELGEERIDEFCVTNLHIYIKA